MTSILPKEFFINLDNLSSSDKTTEQNVTFKKPFNNLSYEGSWDIVKKKPIGEVCFTIKKTGEQMFLTFRENGELNESVPGKFVSDQYEYNGDFKNVDDGWDSKKICIQGQGELIYKKHSKYAVYRGEFSNNVIRGTGTITYVNGSFNKGEWNKDGNLDGLVLFSDPSMDLSEKKCTWSNGKPVKGFTFEVITISRKNGEKIYNAFYTGCWKDGKTFGPGQLIIKDVRKNTVEKYIGLFIDNKLTAIDKYGLPNGMHVELYETKETFEFYNGEWRNGVKNGLGVQFFGKLSISVYNGNWKDNKMSGDGSVVYNPTRNEEGVYDITSIYPFYVGRWNNNKPSGFGILVYDDNAKPIIENNKITNIDKLRCKIGIWKDNKLVEGVEINSNNKKLVEGVEINSKDNKTPFRVFGTKFDDVKKKQREIDEVSHTTDEVSHTTDEVVSEPPHTDFLTPDELGEVHTGIRNIIRDDNTLDELIASHIDLAEIYINSILEHNLTTYTYEECKRLSLKDFMDKYLIGRETIKQIYNTLTALEIEGERVRIGGKTRRKLRKRAKKHTLRKKHRTV